MLVVTLALALGLISAGPAQAKILAEGVIDGAGLDSPIVIAQYPPDDLWEDFGLYPAVFDYPIMEGQAPARLMDKAPTSELGPRLTVTWSRLGPGAAGGIVQDMYLYAAGGPLLHTAPGQAVLNEPHTRGGWFAAPPTLVTNLQALGLPERSVSAGAKADVRTSGEAPADGEERWAWMPIAAGAAAVLTAGAGVFTLLRRRRLSSAVV